MTTDKQPESESTDDSKYTASDDEVLFIARSGKHEALLRFPLGTKDDAILLALEAWARIAVQSARQTP